MSVRNAALWSATGNYLAFAIRFLVSVIVSRFFLAPAEVGVFSIAMSTMLILSVLSDFGIGRFIVGRKHVDRDVLIAANTVVWLFGSLTALLIAAAAFPLADIYDDAGIAPIMLILAASTLATPIAAVPGAQIARALDFKWIAAANILSASVMGIVTIGTALAGASSASLAWGTLAGSVANGIFYAVVKPSPAPSLAGLRQAKEILRFGATNTLLTISGNIGGRLTDPIVGRMAGMTVVGLYSRGAGLTGQLHNLLMGAVAGVFYPAIARLHNEGKDLAPHYERIAAVYGAIVAPAMTLLAVLAYPLVSLLYGARWAGAAPVLSILALAEIVFLALPLNIDIPIALGRIKRLLARNILETIGSVATLLIAARYGLEAAAWSRLAHAFLWFAIYAPFLHALVGFSPRRLGITYIRSLTVAAITALPVLLVYMWEGSVTAVPLFHMTLAVPASGAAWAGALLLVRHPARADIEGLARSTSNRIGHLARRPR